MSLSSSWFNGMDNEPSSDDCNGTRSNNGNRKRAGRARRPSARDSNASNNGTGSVESLSDWNMMQSEIRDMEARGIYSKKTNTDKPRKSNISDNVKYPTNRPQVTRIERHTTSNNYIPHNHVPLPNATIPTIRYPKRYQPIKLPEKPKPTTFLSVDNSPPSKSTPDTPVTPYTKRYVSSFKRRTNSNVTVIDTNFRSWEIYGKEEADTKFPVKTYHIHEPDSAHSDEKRARDAKANKSTTASNVTPSARARVKDLSVLRPFNKPASRGGSPSPTPVFGEFIDSLANSNKRLSESRESCSSAKSGISDKSAGSDKESVYFSAMMGKEGRR
ncbi:hypothetical protein QBC38DRAFT_478513 [Podospora fimiseda]|uniref:Uncharacterized protein n=1 Tax=Podospora fimiseda TaxID=252190 RepID=A0AAN7BPK1_9PEZI|nr:hypothetical protein QBC38DRAFT_478513 [Podospora fimiseda]